MRSIQNSTLSNIQEVELDVFSLLVERVEFVYMDASNLACATWGDGPLPLKRPSIISHPWRTRSATSFSLLPDSVLGICGQDVKFRGTHALHFPYP